MMKSKCKNLKQLINAQHDMKVLIATEKPFAPAAAKGIQEILEKAGHDVAKLENYTEKSIELAQKHNIGKSRLHHYDTFLHLDITPNQSALHVLLCLLRCIHDARSVL